MGEAADHPLHPLGRQHPYRHGLYLRGSAGKGLLAHGDHGPPLSRFGLRLRPGPAASPDVSLRGTGRPHHDRALDGRVGIYCRGLPRFADHSPNAEERIHSGGGLYRRVFVSLDRKRTGAGGDGFRALPHGNDHRLYPDGTGNSHNDWGLGFGTAAGDDVLQDFHFRKKSGMSRYPRAHARGTKAQESTQKDLTLSPTGLHPWSSALALIEILLPFPTNDTISPRLLRAVQGLIGAFNQDGQIRKVRPQKGATDAYVHPEMVRWCIVLSSANRDRKVGNGLAEALGDLDRYGKIRFRQQEDELLAAITSRDINPACVPADAIGQST